MTLNAALVTPAGNKTSYGPKIKSDPSVAIKICSINIYFDIAQCVCIPVTDVS